LRDRDCIRLSHRDSNSDGMRNRDGIWLSDRDCHGVGPVHCDRIGPFNRDSIWLRHCYRIGTRHRDSVRGRHRYRDLFLYSHREWMRYWNCNLKHITSRISEQVRRKPLLSVIQGVGLLIQSLNR
jgi:hypothetical protein